MKTVLYLVLIFCFSVIPTEIAAQPVGSPIFTQSPRKFTLSCNGGLLRKNIYGVKHQSPRFLFKGFYSLSKYFDVFGEVGVTKLHLELSNASRSDFKDKYHLALGAGVILRYFYNERMRFFLFFSGQIFRFTSNPSSEMIQNFVGIEVKQVLALKYDWREANFNLGFFKGMGLVNLFSGMQAELIQRLETKINKNIIAGRTDSENMQSGEYKSGLQMNPFLGIDLKLPSRCVLSLEIIGRSKSDFVFNIGISQTGKP